MSLRTRVLLPIGVLALVVVFGATRVFIAVQQRGRALDELTSELRPASRAVDRLAFALFQQAAAVEAFTTTRDPDARVRFDDARRDETGASRALGRDLRGRTGLEADLRAATRAVSAWQRETAEPAFAGGSAAPPTFRAIADAREAVAKLAAHVDDAVVNVQRRAGDSDAFRRELAIIGAVFALLAAIGTWFWLERSLLRPLDRLRRTVHGVAAGDVDTPVQATGPPELLALAADIEHVRARMDDTVNETLRRRLVQAQEEERRALAAHIHDDPVQVLTALSMRLQALRRDLDDPDQAAELAELDRLVRDTMSRLRELLFELHPPTLDDEGLVAAIDLYLRERAPRDLVWRVDSDLPTPGGSTLPGPVRTLAYRLAREAIWNAVVHSGASLLEVFIALRDGGLELRVRDDGRGFDLARAEDERPGHLGLANVRELAEGFGGQLHIDSHPDVGTSIDIWLPVPEV